MDVLIVDDETLARRNIKHLLQLQDDISNIWEASDGQEAIDLANQHKPDIIFLDIQMPGKSGLQVAELLPPDCLVIFATAYDQYAISAFELNAIDYLLKPFDDERFNDALNRARQQIKDEQIPDIKMVSQLINLMRQEEDHKYKSRLVIKDPGRIRLIDVTDINFIAGAGNYAEIHLFDKQIILHRETLSSLEEQLNPDDFIRIHRSTIVRRSSISELKATEKGDYLVLLKSGDSLTLSRRNKAKLAELLN